MSQYNANRKHFFLFSPAIQTIYLSNEHKKKKRKKKNHSIFLVPRSPSLKPNRLHFPNMFQALSPAVIILIIVKKSSSLPSPPCTSSILLSSILHPPFPLLPPLAATPACAKERWLAFNCRVCHPVAGFPSLKSPRHSRTQAVYRPPPPPPSLCLPPFSLLSLSLIQHVERELMYRTQ